MWASEYTLHTLKKYRSAGTSSGTSYDDDWYMYASTTELSDDEKELNPMFTCGCKVIRNGQVQNCGLAKTLYSRFCSTHHGGKVKLQKKKNESHNIVLNKSLSLEERRNAANDVYWYRKILVNMYSDNDPKHILWETEAKELAADLNSLLIESTESNTSVSSTTVEEENMEELLVDTEKIELSDREKKTEKNRRKRANQQRKAKAHAKEMAIMESFEKMNKKYLEEVNEYTRKYTSLKEDNKKSMSQFIDSIGQLKTPNRLIIIELKYLGPIEAIIEPYFLFIYTFEESETRFKLWASTTINFPISILKNHGSEYEVGEDNHKDMGVAFKGVSSIGIPIIPPTSGISLDFDTGTNLPINQIANTLSLLIEAVKGRPNHSMIPIVMFETIKNVSSDSQTPLKLSSHKFNATATIKEEVFRNPLYSCNMLYDLIKFMPSFFEADKDKFIVQRFESMTKVTLNKLGSVGLKGIKCWNVDAYNSNFLHVLKVFIVKNNIHRQRLRMVLADAQKSKHQGRLHLPSPPSGLF